VLSRLLEHGKVTVAELSRSLNVSEMTIRRDLEELADRGVAKRIYGGAVLANPRAVEPGFADRVAVDASYKAAIGRAAAALVNDGDAVIVDAGTTTLEAARALIGRRDLTVCPLSFQATALLATQPGITVLTPGGQLRPGELMYIGPVTERMLAEFQFDIYLMAVGGISAERGLTDFFIPDVEVKKRALRSARRVVVTADATKIDAVAFARIGPVDSVDVLVTDQRADPDALAALADHGIEVIVADEASPHTTLDTDNHQGSGIR